MQGKQMQRAGIAVRLVRTPLQNSERCVLRGAYANHTDIGETEFGSWYARQLIAAFLLRFAKRLTVASRPGKSNGVPSKLGNTATLTRPLSLDQFHCGRRLWLAHRQAKQGEKRGEAKTSTAPAL